ncbi:MAG: hypothetical protein KDJ36_00160 [Hyphomicrobiaceae bacterium]|nr:hypothetical protein [Hyphomicrobiaceae bacterium]
MIEIAKRDALPRDAARTEDEVGRLKILPLDERKDRVTRALSAGFDEVAELDNCASNLTISRHAYEDLAAIAAAYGNGYAEDVRRYIDALAAGDARVISRRYTRHERVFWRFRAAHHDIYFLRHGEAIGVARILVPYFMRPDKGQPAKAPRPPRLTGHDR